MCDDDYPFRRDEVRVGGELRGAEACERASGMR